MHGVFEDSDEGIEAARLAGMTATDVRLVYRPHGGLVFRGSSKPNTPGFGRDNERIGEPSPRFDPIVSARPQ